MTKTKLDEIMKKSIMKMTKDERMTFIETTLKYMVSAHIQTIAENSFNPKLLYCEKYENEELKRWFRIYHGMLVMEYGDDVLSSSSCMTAALRV